MRRDEEEARAKDEAEAQRLADADRSDRLATLRRRRDVRDGVAVETSDASITTHDGHINFWQDCESGHMPQAKEAPKQESLSQYMEKTALELQPWYANADLRNGREQRKTEDEQLEDCYKDTVRKSSHDPLNAVQTYMRQKAPPRTWGAKRAPEPQSMEDERQAREARERERAAQLRAKRTPDRFFRHEARARRDARSRDESRTHAHERAKQRRALG